MCWRSLRAGDYPITFTFQMDEWKSKRMKRMGDIITAMTTFSDGKKGRRTDRKRKRERERVTSGGNGYVNLRPIVHSSDIRGKIWKLDNCSVKLIAPKWHWGCTEIALQLISIGI